MSSTAKVLLVLGSIAGVFLLLCCGGGVYVFYKAKDMFSMSANPQDVKQRTQEIVQIDVPNDFVPVQAVTFSIPNMMSMKWAVYTKGSNHQSMLMLMEMNQPGMAAHGGAGAKQQRDQMLQAMRQHQGQQGGANFNTAIEEESSETREFTIGGKAVQFEFIKGKRPGTKTPSRQVLGVFPARDGFIMLMVIVDESEYDEEALVRMIQSIRLPGNAAAPVSEDASDSAEPAEKTSENPEEMEDEVETEASAESASP